MLNQFSNHQVSRKRRRYWIAISVIFLVSCVSLALFGFLLRDFDWTVLREFGWSSLLLVLGLSVVGTVSYTLAVYILVSTSGYRTTLVQTYLILTSSLSANYVTPIKAGIPLRIYLYNHFMDMPASVGTALVAVETFVGMFTPALAATIGIRFLFPGISVYLPIALLIALITCAIVLVFVPMGFVARLLKPLPWRSFTRRVTCFLEQVQVGLRGVPLWVMFILMVLFALNFMVHATRLYLILQVLRQPIGVMSLFFALTASVTTGNLSMIPMGLGVRDASLTLLLMQLGVTNEVALSAAVIQRLFAPGWPLLLGIISTNVLGVSELIKRSGDTKTTPEES